MSRGKSLVTIAVIVFIFLSSITASANEMAERQAIAASNAWLKLIDSGQYAESWKTAAELFRNAINKEQWNQSLNAVRKPLGKVFKRNVKSKQYATSLPGVPDGQYVVIQYETVFENKKTSIETVTTMKDKDGKWRVSGYYIK